jgi:hypothetical protein
LSFFIQRELVSVAAGGKNPFTVDIFRRKILGREKNNPMEIPLKTNIVSGRENSVMRKCQDVT